MPTLRYNDGIGRLSLLAARSLFPLTSREIRNRLCIVLAPLFLLPTPARLMRERKLERIALVVRIHDGRELVGEILVEIFEQRANREQLRRDVVDTPIELYVETQSQRFADTLRRRVLNTKDTRRSREDPNVPSN